MSVTVNRASTAADRRRQLVLGDQNGGPVIGVTACSRELKSLVEALAGSIARAAFAEIAAPEGCASQSATGGADGSR